MPLQKRKKAIEITFFTHFSEKTSTTYALHLRQTVFKP